MEEDACFYVFIRFGVHFLRSVNDVMVNSVLEVDIAKGNCVGVEACL